MLSLLTLVTCLSGGFALADQSLTVTASDGTISAQATVTIGNFNRSAHTYTLKRLTSETAQRVFIDGRFAWGLEGTDVIEYPTLEIRSIVMTIGDRKVTLPAEAFSDCYEPTTVLESTWNGKPTGWKYYYLWVSSAKSRATLKLLCSDGTAGYRVLWFVNADGTWTRQVEPFD